MKVFFSFVQHMHEMLESCVYFSKIFFDASDQCTLPIHFVKFLLQQWPF